MGVIISRGEPTYTGPRVTLIDPETPLWRFGRCGGGRSGDGELLEALASNATDPPPTHRHATGLAPELPVGSVQHRSASDDALATALRVGN
jgi:hypothetical protein